MTKEEPAGRPDTARPALRRAGIVMTFRPSGKIKVREPKWKVEPEPEPDEEDS